MHLRGNIDKMNLSEVTVGQYLLKYMLFFYSQLFSGRRAYIIGFLGQWQGGTFESVLTADS